MLHLQAREVDNVELTDKFEEAARRVATVGRAHERLYRTDNIESMDLGIYVEEVCKDMDTSVAHCAIHVDAQPGTEILSDRAVSVALIVVELVTISAKYAYPDRQEGHIWVRIERGSNMDISLSVRDEGVGLPANFDPNKSKGLGMRIVTAFTRQLNTQLTFHRLAPGTEFKITIPSEAVRRP
jgi:two-component sensor histidine kinase